MIKTTFITLINSEIYQPIGAALGLLDGTVGHLYSKFNNSFV
jgi:hypothetical protein